MKRVFGKQALALLLTFVVLLGMFPTAAFAQEQEPAPAEGTSVLDAITTEAVFAKIRGSNSSPDQITGDLQDPKANGQKFYAHVSETGVITWDCSPWYGTPRANVEFEWISSSAPDYIGVTAAEAGKEERILKLYKRPEADKNESAQAVTLTVKVTDRNTSDSKLVELPLTVIPGGHIQTELDLAKEGLFDSIRGTNTTAGEIHADLVFPVELPNDNPAWISVGTGKPLEWKDNKYYAYQVIAEFGESDHPEILKKNAKGYAFIAPSAQTTVTIPVVLRDRYKPSITESFSLVLATSGSDGSGHGGDGGHPQANKLDVITETLLADAIKGENPSLDAVTKPLRLPPNDNDNPFYAKLNDDGSFKQWWASPYGAHIKVELTKSSHPDLIQCSRDGIKILSFPTADTVVDLSFTVTEKDNAQNTKQLIIPVTLKGISAGNKLDVFTQALLFDAIKGENTAADSITKPLTLPARANESNPFYARLKPDGSFDRWFGSPVTSAAKIEITESSDPSLLQVGPDLLTIVKFPDTDTVVTLTFKVSDLSDKGNAKTVSLPLTLKSQSAPPAPDPVEQELQNALDTYLVPEQCRYTTIKRPGVDFQTDYAAQNVRYRFTLPRVSNLAGYGWGEVTTAVSVNDESALQKINAYVWEPIRADVGGKAKTVTLTYTLTKDGKSVSKEIPLTIPPLNQAEIDEELAVLSQVQKHFFDGIQYSNFDAQNVTSDLQMFQEVNYTPNASGEYTLNWVDNAKSKLYYGFSLPTGRGFDIAYPDGDESVFDGSNLVLTHRPVKDVRAVISSTISSIQLGRYASLYPKNADLQKLLNVPVSAEVTVKPVNADLDRLTIEGQDIPVAEIMSLLTDTTLPQVTVSPVLHNQGAKLVIAGTDCGHIHTQIIPLTNGYRTFLLSVSDEDPKQAGSRIEKTYTVSVVSKAYLETEIKKLPEDPRISSASQRKLAGDLLTQYDALTPENRQKIAGRETLECYRAYVQDTTQIYREQLQLTADQLLSAILGDNPNADTVYTDLNGIYYASITEKGVVFTKEANESDVAILWTKSSQPAYVDIHDSNDFDGRYVEAFHLNQRPKAGTDDLPVTFHATLKHLGHADTTLDTTVSFTLKAYNAKLSDVKIDIAPDFSFDSQTYDYELQSNTRQAVITLTPQIPGVRLTVTGGTLEGNILTVPLTQLPHTVKIVVNDQVKNTLNSKWDEKTYNITFRNAPAPAVNKDALRSRCDEALAIDKKLYESGTVKALEAAIAQAQTVLDDAGALQSAVDTALEQLNTAIANLVPLPPHPEIPENPELPPVPSQPESKKNVVLSIEGHAVGRGYIAEPTELPIREGDSVYDVLERFTREHNISMTAVHSGQYGGYYISEIGGLRDQVYGALSGWLYFVNEDMPNFTADQYTLQGGEVIRFRYTTNYGEDLKPQHPGDGFYHITVKAENGSVRLPEGPFRAGDSVTVVATADSGFSLAALSASSPAQPQIRMSTEDGKTFTFRMPAGDVSIIAQFKKVEASTSNPLDAILMETGRRFSAVTSGFGSEWAVLGLARHPYPVSRDYFVNYYKDVETTLKETGGVLSTRKYTEYSRTILALTAAGYDPRNVSGYDLIAPLADFDRVKAQGINGPIFALLALDSHHYEIPKAPVGQTQTTREALIDELLAKELSGGGWSLSGSTADVDITAMAMQALAPYYKDNAKVRSAVDRSLTLLSATQQENGNWLNQDGAQCPETAAQVLIALSALNIDAAKDSRFIQNGRTVIDAVSDFYLGDGAFAHDLSLGADGMAAEQSYRGLVAYLRLQQGKSPLYDMTDVQIHTGLDIAGGQKPTTPKTGDMSSLFAHMGMWSVSLILLAMHKKKAVR